MFWQALERKVNNAMWINKVEGELLCGNFVSADGKKQLKP